MIFLSFFLQFINIKNLKRNLKKKNVLSYATDVSILIYVVFLNLDILLRITCTFTTNEKNSTHEHKNHLLSLIYLKPRVNNVLNLLACIYLNIFYQNIG